LPGAPSAPSGLTIGASYTEYSHGAVTHLSIGYIPNFSDLSHPAFGGYAQIPF